MVKIFNSSNSEEYLVFLSKLDYNLDIYYQPKYLEFDAKTQKGEYEIFTLEKDGDVFIFPYIKLYFNEKRWVDFFDITSPYGYCGPFSTTSELYYEGTDIFIKSLSNKCVTIFVRYHYLYNHNRLFTNFINLQNRTLVILDLNKEWEDIWKSEFSSTNRNLYRKLEKEGYVFTISDEIKDLNIFIELYYSTMKHVGAEDFYYFEKKILFDFFNESKDYILLGKIEKNSIIFSMALFFVSGEIATYYLSARDLKYSNIPSSNLLLSSFVKFLHTKSVKLINFGGGLTNIINDPLFKFKANFSKSTMPYFIGKKINNIEVYNQLISEYTEINGVEKYNKKKDVLQFYRT